jgi:hypothetical protein
MELVYTQNWNVSYIATAQQLDGKLKITLSNADEQACGINNQDTLVCGEGKGASTIFELSGGILKADNGQVVLAADGRGAKFIILNPGKLDAGSMANNSTPVTSTSWVSWCCATAAAAQLCACSLARLQLQLLPASWHCHVHNVRQQILCYQDTAAAAAAAMVVAGSASQAPS